ALRRPARGRRGSVVTSITVPALVAPITPIAPVPAPVVIIIVIIVVVILRLGLGPAAGIDGDDRALADLCPTGRGGPGHGVLRPAGVHRVPEPDGEPGVLQGLLGVRDVLA